jgi:hypothetical protein
MTYKYHIYILHINIIYRQISFIRNNEEIHRYMHQDLMKKETILNRIVLYIHTLMFIHIFMYTAYLHIHT